ncbi:MAG: hypothetical protein Q9175_005620 [Cornicularia normoerica]
MTNELHQDGKTNLQHGHILHSEIIGRNTRDLVKSSRGADLRVYLPTLAEYVKMTPRIVTPIYPADANLIVSLLDIHASPSPLTQGPPSLEILEAGTGHGGLTLYLARAIHAANIVRPNINSPSSKAVEGCQPPSHLITGTPSAQRPSGQEGDLNSQSKSSYEYSSDNRQAVVHTLDLSWRHSKHAEQIVKGFRYGLYANDIVFHVGDVSQWIDEQVSNRGLGPDENAFLSHIVLDMPSSSHHVEKAASVLHTNGNLLAFNPSITQIISIVKIVKQLGLPLVLSSVLELGPNISGGKDWDVRTVIPRSLTRKAKAPTREDDASENPDQDLDDGAVANTAEGDDQRIHDQVGGMAIVCRPKVGYRVAGGGFLGVWKKMKY